MSFVGSTPIARYVYETGTRAGKRVQALGGAKNHMVVLPDADMDLAADSAVSAAYGSAGERCMAISVLVTVGDAADRVLPKIRERVRKLKDAPGLEPGPELGPLVTKEHHAKVASYVERGQATEELKDRIRSKIREAIDAFSTGKSEESFLKELVKQQVSAEDALRLLWEALRTFDKASIFTIHGFCRRMLHENAFESGSLFDTELVTDPSAMIQESTDDFWRRHLTTASPLFVDYARLKGFTPEGLVSLFEEQDEPAFSPHHSRRKGT